jgi:hypothetical protein
MKSALKRPAAVTLLYIILTLAALTFTLTMLIGNSYAYFYVAKGVENNSISSGSWLYTVNYHLNGGMNNALNPDTYSEYTPTPLHPASYTNQSFIGWFMSSDGSGSAITEIPSGLNGEINLYAFWMSPGLSLSNTNGNSEYSVSQGTCNNTHVIIPNYYNGKPVTVIAASGFRYNYDIESIVLSDNLKTIKNGAFSYCRYLESITIPASVTSIEKNAFSYCTYLESLTILKTTSVITGGTNMFLGDNYLRIYVPSNLLNTYKKAARWKSYASIIYAS